MRLLLPIVTTLIWALWFGGMITLFISVQVLFKTDRTLAVQAAPLLFGAFGKYQIALGILAVAASIAARFRPWIAGLFLVATILAIVHLLAVETPMELLRADGLSGTDRFKKLHGVSMMIYVSQAALLLVTGALIPRAIRTSGGTAAG